MATKIFINLPVSNLQKAMDFYSNTGFTNNPQFMDETAACMFYSDEIFVMLLTYEKFKEFTTKQIANTHKTASVINSLSMKSHGEVNEFMERAIKAGGKETGEAKDYGFMQQRSLEDLDWHLWEILYMDMTKIPNQN